MSDESIPKLLTMPEVAELIRTPLPTLRFWRHQGDGPANFKIGRRVMYRETDVVAWFNEQVAGGAK